MYAAVRYQMLVAGINVQRWLKALTDWQSCKEVILATESDIQERIEPDQLRKVRKHTKHRKLVRSS
jgi:hypothetical protein